MNRKITPIRNDEDMKAALARVEEIFFAEPGADEFDELEVLGSLIHDYQAVYHPVAPLDPIDMLQELMKANGLKAADLVPAIGPPGRVSEILHRKRRLTVEMIRHLSQLFQVSTDVFIDGNKTRSWVVAEKTKPYGQTSKKKSS